MNYNIKGTGLAVTDEIRAYVEKGFAQAEKYLGGDQAAHADVELEYQALRHGDHYRAEFTLASGGAVYRADAWGQTMHAAIDLTAAALSRELRRTKRKRLHLLRSTGASVKEYLRGWRRKV